MIPVLVMNAGTKALPAARYGVRYAVPFTKWAAKTIVGCAALDLGVHTVFRVATRAHFPHPHADGEYVASVGHKIAWELLGATKFAAGSACAMTAFLGFIPAAVTMTAGLGLELGLAAVVTPVAVGTYAVMDMARPGRPENLNFVKEMYAWTLGRGFDVFMYPTKWLQRGQLWLVDKGYELRADWSMTSWLADRLEARKTREDAALRSRIEEINVPETDAGPKRRVAKKAVPEQRAVKGTPDDQIVNDPEVLAHLSDHSRPRNPAPIELKIDPEMNKTTEQARQTGFGIFFQLKAQCEKEHRDVVEGSDNYRRRLPRDLKAKGVGGQIHGAILGGYDSAHKAYVREQHASV